MSDVVIGHQGLSSACLQCSPAVQVGVISHKVSHCAMAGRKLEMIVGQNQYCLPSQSVTTSISCFRMFTDRFSLSWRTLLAAGEEPEEETF